MEVCNVETGLLRKKPCGHPAVTHCLNCEQALCAQHAIAELSAAGKKSGKFVCHDCQAAARDYQKRLADMKKDTTSPLSRTAKKPDAPAPAQAKPAAAQAKPNPPAADKKPGGDDGAIEFTPSKDKK